MKAFVFVLASIHASFRAGHAIQLRGNTDDYSIYPAALSTTIPPHGNPNFDALCDEKYALRISDAQVVYWNLDNSDHNLPQAIRVANVLPASGVLVDMILTPNSSVTANHVKAGDDNDPYVQTLHINPGAQVDLKVQFVNHINDAPLVMPDFAMTIGDLDNEEGVAGLEYVTVAGHSSYSVSVPSSVQVNQIDGHTTEFTSTASDHGDGRYASPSFILAPEERSQAVMLTFTNTSEFSLVLRTGPSEAARRFVLSGTSNVACPRKALCEEWTCPPYHQPRTIATGGVNWCHGHECSAAAGDALRCCVTDIPAACKDSTHLLLSPGNFMSGSDLTQSTGLYWSNVVPHSGRKMGLRVTTDSTYTIDPHDTLSGIVSLGVIEVAWGSRVDLQFSFVDEEPYHGPDFPVIITFYNLRTLIGGGIQEVTVRGNYSERIVSKNTTIQDFRHCDEYPTNTASALEEDGSTFEDLAFMTQDMLDASVSYKFETPMPPTFLATLTVQGDYHHLKNGRFAFGGSVANGCPEAALCSSMECPAGYLLKSDADDLLCLGPVCEIHDSTLCCEEEKQGLCSAENILMFEEGAEIVNNLGNHGPQAHLDSSIVVSNVFPMETEPIDMVVNVVHSNTKTLYSKLRVVFLSVWGGSPLDVDSADGGPAVQVKKFNFHHCNHIWADEHLVSVTCDNCASSSTFTRFAYTGLYPDGISVTFTFDSPRRVDAISFVMGDSTDSRPKNFQLFAYDAQSTGAAEDWKLLVDHSSRNLPQPAEGEHTSEIVQMFPMKSCGGYTPGDSKQNRIANGFLDINVATGSAVDLNFQFVKRADQRPYHPHRFYFTVAGLRNGTKGVQAVSASDYHNYTVAGVEAMGPKHSEFFATKLPDDGASDAVNLNGLDALQVGNSVSFLFVGKASVSLTLSVQNSQDTLGGANFKIGGASSKVCPQALARCGTFQCPSARPLRSGAFNIICAGGVCDARQCCLPAQSSCDRSHAMELTVNSLVPQLSGVDANTGRLSLVYENVFPHSNRNCRLLVQSDGQYTPPSGTVPEFMTGAFGNIPMQAGSQLKLKFKLVDKESGGLVQTPPPFMFTVIDLDTQFGTVGGKSLEVAKHFNGQLSKHSFVLEHSPYSFVGVYPNSTPVSGHPLAMAPNLRHRSVAFPMHQSEWAANLRVNSESDSSFQFAGISNVVCNAVATCDTMQCPAEWMLKEGADRLACSTSTCGPVDKETCCKMELCEPSRQLDFETVEYSNIGNTGSELDQGFPAALVFSDVFPSDTDDSRFVDLHIAATGQGRFHSKEPLMTGAYGGFARINMMSGREVTLDFSFSKSGSSGAAVEEVKPFIFSYLAMSSSKVGQGQQSVTICGHESWEVTPTSSVRTEDASEENNRCLKVLPTSGTLREPVDATPSLHPHSLSHLQMNHLISFHMPATREFTVTLTATSGSEDVSFLFAGMTNMNCKGLQPWP